MVVVVVVGPALSLSPLLRLLRLLRAQSDERVKGGPLASLERAHGRERRELHCRGGVLCVGNRGTKSCDCCFLLCETPNGKASLFSTSVCVCVKPVTLRGT